MAIPVGLLFWLNLMSRVVLLASSWAAGDVDLATLSDEGPRTALATAPRPPFVKPLPATVDTTLLPYAGSLAVAGPLTESPASSGGGAGRLCESGAGAGRSSRAADRVSIAAGAVVGAAGAGAAAALLRRRR